MTRVAGSALEREALRRYVRSRAPDFGADERRDLEVWLAGNADHQSEFARLERTWRRLDSLAGAFKGERTTLMRYARPSRPTRRWLFATLAAGAAAALFITILPGVAVPRRYETATAQQRTINLPAGIDIALNADSAIDVFEGDTTRVDLIRGDIYVDVRPTASGQLEVRAGDAIIRDIGTRFSVTTHNRGGAVAVEEGQVELLTGPAYLRVHAGHSAAFDGAGRVDARALGTRTVAPWRRQRWQFNGASLAALADELSRQQRIRVDIAEPAVAALTVSGSFRFDEPERMLWAAAQVHGLRLQRLDERHFRLQRR